MRVLLEWCLQQASRFYPVIVTTLSLLFLLLNGQYRYFNNGPGALCVLLMMLVWLLLELRRIDKTFLVALVQFFDFLYLAGCIIVFSTVGYYAQLLMFPDQAWATCLNFVFYSLLHLLSLFSDAMVPLKGSTFNFYHLQLCHFLLVVGNAIRIGVSDLISPQFASREICVIWCSDLRSMALGSLFHICLFHVRFSITMIWAWYRSRTGQSPPFAFAMMRRRIHFRVEQPEIRAGARFTVNDGLSIVWHPVLLASQVEEKLQAMTSDLVTASRSMPEPQQFAPLVSHAWLIRIASMRFYWSLFLGYCLATLILVIFLGVTNTWYAVVIWISVVLFLLATTLTRFDRSVCFKIVGTFDWWLLMTELLLNVIFFSMSQYQESGYPLATVDASVGFIVVFGIFLLDGAIALPVWIRRAVLAVEIVFNSYVLLRERFVGGLYTAVPVCMIYCSDSRHLALSSLFSITAYFVRYLIRSSRHPDRFVMVTQPILRPSLTSPTAVHPMGSYVSNDPG